MQFHQDHQPEVQFNFHEIQDFVPEYMPEVVSACHFDNSVLTKYTKQSWLKKMLTLPKIAIFTLEGLDKLTSFSNEVHSSVKKVENRISVLEASQGDFRSLSDRLQKVEMNATDITELKLQMHELKRKNRVITLILIAMSLIILGLSALNFYKS